MPLIRRCSSLTLLIVLLSFSGGRLSAHEPPCKPLHVILYVIRSRLNANLFRYDDAIADMDAAITLDPDNPALYVERGQRIMLLYEWDRALEDYNRALELNADYADAYYFRGILYASVPEGSDARRSALADFQRYLDLAPEGDHATDAARYITELQAQLEALQQTLVSPGS